ncbi:phosphate signaling complex protein PhoU [Colwellia sp. MSW7]|jgi:phosphate transport system protein|uniref:Phosphate signaling complex protein PhoU n=1 Tax=Colwellia maritima TaxID=2912588 RepID=A0ABS9X0P3_9GAMM|nr:phosphate signaling complex protein PhoU [Colwellia maritima]MCI2283789.1 phosphate signaling complex protein PhoU [Colwellia maritima]
MTTQDNSHTDKSSPSESSDNPTGFTTKLHLDKHISRRFNQELEQVRTLVMDMGVLVEKQVNDGLSAVLNADEKLAKKVIKRDKEVNTMELEIDEYCTQILARRQPAASDLRLLVSVIKSITDLERMGDEAVKFGKNAIKLAKYRAIKANTDKEGSIEGNSDEVDTRPLVELKHLGKHVSETLNKALMAYAQMDVEAALEIIRNDNVVDEEFDNISRLLVTKMMENPREIKNALRVTWCARALERIGDHTTNLCEYIVYLVEGKDVRHATTEQIKAKMKT